MQHTKAPQIRLFAVLSCVLFTVTTVSAQQPASTFIDSIDVDIVNVEVVVTDKQGLPITGLTRDDFEIFEDGQAMELTNFHAVDGLGVDPGVAHTPAAELAAAPARPTGSTQRLNLVIFVDNVNIRPENRKALFDNLRKKLHADALPGSRVMMVAMNQRVEVIEPFTDDLDRIFAAMDGMEKQTSINALADGQRRMFLSRLARSDIQDFPCSPPGRPPPPPPPGSGTGTGAGSRGRTGGGNSSFIHAIRDAKSLAQDVLRLGEQRFLSARSALQAMEFFTDTLGGMPGRKALIYLSDGIPTHPAESLSEAWIAKYALWVQQHGSCLDTSLSSVLGRASTGSSARQFNLRGELSRLREKASDNRVAIYPISNHGRGGSMASAEIPGSTDGASGTMIRVAMVAEAQDRAATLLQMAEDTGGLALTSTANIGELVDRMSQDFSSFYSLGYVAPEAKRDGAYHKIQIKVRREGAKVRHVAGRRDKSWIDRLGDMTAAAALYGLEANPLGIHLQRADPIPQGNRFKAPILVQIPFSQIEMVSQGENFTADLTLLVVVRDSKGGFSDPRQFDLPIQIPQDKIDQARQQAAAYPIELNLKKNAKVVAVGVRDNIGQTAACVKLDYDFGGGDDDEDDKKAKKKKKRKKSKKG